MNDYNYHLPPPFFDPKLRNATNGSYMSKQLIIWRYYNFNSLKTYTSHVKKIKFPIYVPVLKVLKIWKSLQIKNLLFKVKPLSL